MPTRLIDHATTWYTHHRAATRAQQAARDWAEKGGFATLLRLRKWRVQTDPYALRLHREDNTFSPDDLQVPLTGCWEFFYFTPWEYLDTFYPGEMQLRYVPSHQPARMDDILRMVAELHEAGFRSFPPKWRKIAPLARQTVALCGY